MNRTKPPEELESLLCSKLGLMKQLAVYFEIPQSFREDFVQEVFIAAYNGLHQLREPEKINAWLYKTAYRKMIACGIQRRKTQELEINYSDCVSEDWEPFESSSYKLWCVMEHGVDKDTIKSIVNSFEPPVPDIIWLRFDQGFSLVEIAEMLQINYNTVKTIETRAFSKIKKLLEREMD